MPLLFRKGDTRAAKAVQLILYVPSLVAVEYTDGAGAFVIHDVKHSPSPSEALGQCEG